MRKSMLPFLLATLLAPAAKGEVPLVGDAASGESLFRMECAACHGPNGAGAETFRKAAPGGHLPNLSDSAFLATRSDDELHATMTTGQGKERWIPGHSFANLTPLQRWDIVQWLRDASLPVEAFFPEVVKFTAKDFLIDEHGAKRLQGLNLPAGEADRSVVVLTAYRGSRKANESIRLIPWNPVELDLLKADERLGFLTFTDLEVPKTGEKVHVGLAFDASGRLQKVRVRHPDPAKRTEIEKVLATFVGQGARTATELKAPKTLRDGDAWAKAMTRATSLSVEAILMFDKAEKARTAFDR